MKSKTTITINGRLYDATSGLPVDIEVTPVKQVPNRGKVHDITPPKTFQTKAEVQKKPPAAATSSPSRNVQTARAVHARQQRSHTLHRSALKKPKQATASHEQRIRVRVEKSHRITKFAPHPQAITPSQRSETVAAPAQPHPVQIAAAAAQQASKNLVPPKQLSSRALKQQLINAQLDSLPSTSSHHKEVEPEQEHKGFMRLSSRARATVVACLALVVLGGYLTYLNVPSLSLRVAAARAGIAAGYPEYHPDGYSFGGPPTYSEGRVAVAFASNTGAKGYTLTQEASNWDSGAVLDNYVAKNAKNDYKTYSASGLTIYTFDQKAAWVNRGILHTIDYKDSLLSPKQIERIATSL